MRKLKLEELGRPNLEDYKKISKVPVIVILDNIRSAMNVGSFFRTCDAFKIDKIILCGITGIPPHKEILKTAIGATQSVNWSYAKDIIEVITTLKKDNYKVVGIEQTDESIALSDFTVRHEYKYALIFGNEVNGINEQVLPLLDNVIEIAQYGTKHSLNVSVCGGIVIWTFARPFLH